METETLKLGDKKLKEIAQPVIDFNKELVALIDQMYFLLKKYHGVGLAAPQIGISKRIIVYGLENNSRYPNIENVPFNALINPVILYYSEKQDEFFEGCLSIPNVRGPVERSTYITGYAQDQSGNIINFQEGDFIARIIQHEVDHLNGINFLQRIKDNSRIIYSAN
jgi:peptide deformylase